MSFPKPLTLRHLCHLLNNILGFFYHRHIVFFTISLVKNTKCYLPKKSAPEWPRNKRLATTCCKLTQVSNDKNFRSFIAQGGEGEGANLTSSYILLFICSSQINKKFKYFCLTFRSPVRKPSSKTYDTKKVYRYWLAAADNRLLTAYLF